MACTATFWVLAATFSAAVRWVRKAVTSDEPRPRGWRKAPSVISLSLPEQAVSAKPSLEFSYAKGG